MQHTPNFHLPQWDETDRVLRSDFNSAMANIEDGLSSSAAKDQELDEKITGVELVTSQSLTSSITALRSDAMESLYRLAFNNYCCIAEADAPIWQTAGFHQRMTGEGTALPDGVSGMLHRGSSCWMARSPDGLSPDGFTTEVVQELHITSNNMEPPVPLIAIITPSVSGILDSINVHVYTPQCSIYNSPHFTFTFADAECGVVEASGEVQWSPDKTVGVLKGPTFPCGVPVCQGRRYELRVVPLYSGYEFRIRQNSIDPIFTLSPVDIPTATLTRSFSVEDVSRGGALWVRCFSGGAGGTMSLNWGGKTLSPRIIRSVTTGKGEQMMDAEFRNDAATAKNQRVTLTIHCNKGGTIELKSWSAAMI